MTQQTAKAALTFVHNGVDRPVHQDRQVLRAGDLTLEQQAQDAMLDRARRYLHGWGVVAGFAPEIVEGKLLTVGPGYGVTPTGAELFLPEQVALEDAWIVAWARCGPGATGCDVIDREEIEKRRREEEGTTVTAWLIARPASRLAVPRAGVPEGCAHPASTLLPSRRCGGVEFDILCSLPPSHQPQEPDCAKLDLFVCGAPRAGALPLPWEVPAGTDDDFLVIARLEVTAGAVAADTAGRRQLWPVALIQDWIAACICPLDRREEPPETPRGPDGDDTIVGPEIDDTLTFVGPEIDDTLTFVGPEIDDTLTLVGPEIDDTLTFVGPEIDDTLTFVGPGIDDTIIGPEIDDTLTFVGPRPIDTIVGPRPTDTAVGPRPADTVIGPRPRDTLTGPRPADTLIAPTPSDTLVGPIGRTPIGPDIAIAIPRLTRRVGRRDVVLSRAEVLELRGSLAEPVSDITGIGERRVEALAEIGVRSQGEFLTTDDAVLGRVLNLTEEKVIEMKKEVGARNGLRLG